MPFETLLTRKYDSVLVLSSGKAPFFKKWIFFCVVMHADRFSIVADSAQALSVHSRVGGRCRLNCKIMFRFVQIPALKIKVVGVFFSIIVVGSDASQAGSERFYPQPHDYTCSPCFVNISGSFAWEPVVTHKAARPDACLWKWDKISGSRIHFVAESLAVTSLTSLKFYWWKCRVSGFASC